MSAGDQSPNQQTTLEFTELFRIVQNLASEKERV